MKQVKFVKYNKTRKEEFQIKTCIYEEDGTTYVEKSAVFPKGKAHIASFETKYDMIKDCNLKIKVLKPIITHTGMSYPYMLGNTLAELLGEQIKMGQVPIDAINDAMNLVFGVKRDFVIDFKVTPEFTQVFGVIPSLKDKSYKATNIDGLFENMLVTANGIFCLDYEWVFDFPIPLNYVKYRNILYFYQKYQSLINYSKLESFLKEFGITREMSELYQKMETSFQKYVHGQQNDNNYLENYQKPNKSFEEILDLDLTLTNARDRILQLQAEVEEKNLTIRKTQEVQRLTNNHVTNLEVMIGDLRKEIEVQAQTVEYLNRHAALMYKLRRKLGGKFNKAFPKGTNKRKVLTYCKRTIVHPIKSSKLYFTAEGRNLIKGDFKIGEEYMQHGKLIFDREDTPKVSIVIPVYNQIYYTYACLLSIKENTKNIPYEIIIADDVSTDATSELGKFVENIIICRNATNQGFVKNCNNAARSARGQYIMFLNNDTQVHNNWLSALITLIESDPTIGMVGSKLIYPDGRLQEAGGIIWSDGSGWNYGRLDNPQKAEYNYVKEVDYISGAAILLPNQLWKQIGGFDERYAPAYCEDSDLAFEVRKAGYRVMYQPLSVVTHFEGISNGTDINGTGLKQYQVENSNKLKDKWTYEFIRQYENNGNPNPFRARERSMGKPVIVVVDHYVPTYDKDAGSKTTFQYLQMFQKMGYVVKFVGDNFLHEEPYTTTLEQMGIEVLYGQDYQVGIWDWLQKNKEEISYIYLNRPHIATKYIDFIKDNTSIPVIYYGHDLHFLRENREYELTGDINKKREADYWKSIELTLMYKANVTYYPSYIERDAINKIDQSIHVKAITAYVYDEFIGKIQDDFSKREGLLFVGGFAHPPNTDAVIWFVEKIYPRIWEKTKAPFYIVGSKVTEEIEALEKPDNGVFVKGFVSDQELALLYSECKLVVVPLRYGAGVKGKVIEAIYHGAPVVTTSIGAEGIPYAEDMLVVEDAPNDFANVVIDLYKNDKRLKEVCHKTQTYIQENFSMDAAWKIIKEDFTL